MVPFIGLVRRSILLCIHKGQLNLRATGDRESLILCPFLGEDCRTGREENEQQSVESHVDTKAFNDITGDCHEILVRHHTLPFEVSFGPAQVA